MSERNIIKHYDNGEITVQWEPAKCIHSGICARGLPSVFKPKERPWVQMENSDSAHIKATIDQCPSQALSYKEDNASYSNPNLSNQNSKDSTMEIDVLKNGPLLVKDEFTMVNTDGSEMKVKKNSALCRCGASAKKPFCDGAHSQVGFEG